MKILIAYDGSADGDESLNDLNLAGLPDKAEVLVLSIAVPWVNTELGGDPGNFYGGPTLSDGGMNRFNKKAKAEAEVLAKRARNHLESKFPLWKVKTSAELDFPAQGILKKADTWKPHLIILGSHGHSALGRILLGSVSQKILHHSHTCVRINRGRVRSEKIPPRLLVGIDGSEDSNLVIHEIATRKWPPGTKVRLVAVTNNGVLLEKILRSPHGKGLTQFETAKAAWIEKKLMEASDKLREKGLHVNTTILTGDPRKVLLKKAADWRVDCIFIGCRGLNGFARFLLGSVSSTVASHAPCTVEVIREK